MGWATASCEEDGGHACRPHARQAWGRGQRLDDCATPGVVLKLLSKHPCPADDAVIIFNFRADRVIELSKVGVGAASAHARCCLAQLLCLLPRSHGRLAPCIPVRYRTAALLPHLLTPTCCRPSGPGVRGVHGL